MTGVRALLALAAAAIAVLITVLITVGAADPADAQATPTTTPTTAAPGETPGIQIDPDLPIGPGAPPVPAPGVEVDGGGGCGFLDASCRAREAINDWFTDLVVSALNPVLDGLGHTVLATPDLTEGRVRELWWVSAGIANTAVVLLVLAGGAVVMGHETLQTRYSVKEIAPRVVVAVVAANASLGLCRLAITIANALSQTFLAEGVDTANASEVFRQLILPQIEGGGIFLVLVGLVVAVLAVAVLATFVIRTAVTLMLIVTAPLALVCHALPHTDGVARLWWRALAGVLSIQVAQSVVLIVALRVFFSPDGLARGLFSTGGLMDLLICVCLLWVLVRIPAWVSKTIFGARRSTIVQTVKTTVIYKAARAAATA